VRLLLSAGLDTTVNGIGIMMLAFASFPDEWVKLRARPELARRALDESLRWDSTVQTFFRTTTGEVEIDGQAIPRDSKVILFLAAANRDPRCWHEADRFDLDRATSGHVAFGFGIHQCLGQMVARMEAELVLGAMIPRIAEIRLAGPPVRRLNNTLHALASLPVEIIAA
jgi:cytochrome P450